jgi:hypothetical protein
MTDSESGAASESSKNQISSSEESPTENRGETVDHDLLERVVEAQVEDARVRERELEVRERELELNREEAEASIQAQVEDRENQRDHYNRIHRRKQRYGIALIVIVLIFLGFLVYIGEQQIALELVKLAVYGGGGYWAGKAVGQYGKEDAEA